VDEEIIHGDYFSVVKGIRTHVRRTGKGKTLVLVHGLGGPLMWQRVEPLLSRYFEVVALDLPGFGVSGCPPQESSTQEYANFLQSFLDVEGIRSAIFVCVSYGGQIVVSFAHDHPERIEKLILISSTGISPRSVLLTNTLVWNIIAVFAKWTILRSRRLVCLLGRFSFYDVQRRPAGLCQQFFEQLSLAGHRDALLSAVRNIYAKENTFTDKVSGLKLPTLLLWGTHDRMVPSHCAFEFHHLMPTSRLEIMPECAHSLPLEKPDEVCDAIRTFVNTTTTATSD
jgi:pimeloyl-ACP methyl ester carboxylesterase